MNRTARLVPAAVLSAAVICSATAGSAVAAKMITGKDIKNGSITSVDVKNKNLTGKDVKNASLGESKLGAGVKSKLNESHVPGYEVVTETSDIDAGSSGTAHVACPGTKIALGGGGHFVHADDTLFVQGSSPSEYYEESALFAPPAADRADAWAVSVYNGNANLEPVTVYAICVDAG